MRQLAAALFASVVHLATFASAPSAFAQDGALFKYKGKSYTAKDLTPAMQQALFDMQIEQHARMQAFADQVAFEAHVDEQVKKTGKTRQEVEESLFTVKEPTDKDVSDWYEANKGRIPPNYTLDQIAGEIKTMLKGEGRKTQREELLGRLRKEGGLTLAMGEPQAPAFKIDSAGFPRRGPASAKLTLVEFADYQCPHCKHAGEAIEKMLKKYDGKVSLVFMDFPIKGESSARIAYGAFCAEQQGKFWEYHDMAFAKQGGFGSNAAGAIANELKLDKAKFDACMASKDPEQRVAKSRAEAERIGVSGTPAVFLNGKRVKGIEEKDLDEEIARALKGAAH